MLASVLALLVAAAPVAQAGSLNLWGPHTGDGVLAVTPMLFVDATPAVYPYLYLQQGFSPRFEVVLGAGGTVGPSSSFDGLEVMPRLFLTDAVALALRTTTLVGPDVGVAPEVHGTWEREALVVTVNGGWEPWVGKSGFDPGSIYVQIAPEVYVTESTSLYVEVDPWWVFGEEGGAVMELVPGVSTDVADVHYVSVGWALPMLPRVDVQASYLGAWYSVAFGG